MTLNQVGFEGEPALSNQPVAPGTPFYANTGPVLARDLERAGKLMDEAGHGLVKVELMTLNTRGEHRVAEVIQALAAEAGFDVRVNATEFATGLDRQTGAAIPEAFLIGWSGRADPDANTHSSSRAGRAERREILQPRSSTPPERGPAQRTETAARQGPSLSPRERDLPR